MITIDTWETIRIRCRRDGEKIKTVARELGLSPNTVRKYLSQDTPPTRTQKTRPRPKQLDRYQVHVDKILRSTPKVTAVRVGTYLRQNIDSDLRVDQRTLREYVAERRALLIPKEAFIRATYAPGDQAQFDFSPMTVILEGSSTVVQLFVLRSSYSGRFFARASRRCDQPSLFAGLLAGFTAFGGITRSAIFDNASTAVTRVLRGSRRKENEAFAAFRGGLALHVEFAAPAKGNEKGGVEGVHGFIEDNFFRPTPVFSDMTSLNTALASFCEADMERVHSTHHEKIGDRFAREQRFLQPLPAVLPRPCINRCVHINKFSEVCFEQNFYSVPTQFAHRSAVIEVYENRIRVVVGDEGVAEHPRGFGRHERFLDPRHYVELLSYKRRAAQSALVLADGRIPQVIRDLFERYRTSDASTASQRWTQVLLLLKDESVEHLAAAVTHALARGTDDPAAIALLLRQRVQGVSSNALERCTLPEAAQLESPEISLSSYATATLVERAA